MSMKKVQAKVVVIGPQNVGKTSLAMRYVGGKFTRNISPTLGASFLTSKIHIDGIEVKMMIWDTAGQERFKAMTPIYYRNANAAIIVFDLSCHSTFVQCKRWTIELLRNVDYETSVVLCLVGNKTDLKNERQVTCEEAEEYAYSINAQYFETSALNNEGINDVFSNIAKSIIAKTQETELQDLKAFLDSENKNTIVANTSKTNVYCC